MTTVIPDAVIHGLTSRLKDRIPVESLDKLKSQLSGEHDMGRSLTFIVPGTRGFEFHVMIRRVNHQPKSEIEGFTPPPFPRWQTIILVVTKTIGFLYDEAPNVSISITSEPPPGALIVEPKENAS